MEPDILQLSALLQLVFLDGYVSLFDGSGRTEIILQWLLEDNCRCPENANDVYPNVFRQLH